MKGFDPSLLIPVFAIVVFGVPWFILLFFVVRDVMYGRSRGIPFFCSTRRMEMSLLRKRDPRAATNHRRVLVWAIITGAMWSGGSTILVLALIYLYSRGLL